MGVSVIEIVCRIEIDAAHRVMGHEGKCRHLHGHRFVFEVHVQRKDRGIDGLGRVIDFGAVKAEIGGYLNMEWDHATILNRDDPVARLWQDGGALEGHKYCLIPYNPTAENLAIYLLNACRNMFANTDIDVMQVDVWETPNNRASVTRDEATRGQY